LLAAFSQIYSEDQEQKAEQKEMKNKVCSEKPSSKVEAKESVGGKKLAPIEKKPQNFASGQG
jgi:hypothetical protein